MADMCGLQDYKKNIYLQISKTLSLLPWFLCISFQAFRPIWLAISTLGSLFWLVDTFFSETISTGQLKVAAKISNQLGTRSHRSHLSGALLQTVDCRRYGVDLVQSQYWAELDCSLLAGIQIIAIHIFSYTTVYTEQYRTHCILHTAHYTLHTAHCMLHTTHCTL